MKHLFYDIIVAYLNNEIIQYKSKNGEYGWTDIFVGSASNPFPNFNDKDVKYRYKPRGKRNKIKHFNHDIIIAYINGKNIQCKYKDTDWEDVVSVNCGQHFPAFNVQSLDWRLNPT